MSLVHFLFFQEACRRRRTYRFHHRSHGIFVLLRSSEDSYKMIFLFQAAISNFFPLTYNFLLYYSHGSYAAFPKTQSFAQNTLPPRPHFIPERSNAFSYPPVASTVSSPFILPPPDFSVPPPFPTHTLQG